MSNKLIILLLSILFVGFSFSPSFYEIFLKKTLPIERAFVLEHNYMFDFNFYLSRIREGQEGRWMVVEKYYNLSHNGSLLQVFYLLLGKVGGIFGLVPVVIYHVSRVFLGLILLLLIGSVSIGLFRSRWSIIAFLFIVTAGSFPKPVWFHGFYRFATYMGWWSVIDPLQRITFIPHILFGQIGLLWLLIKFSTAIKKDGFISWIFWGVAGFVTGIIFPPTLIILYAALGILSMVEIFDLWKNETLTIIFLKEWFKEKIFPRIIFFIFSVPALLYLNLILTVMPWKSLVLFDMQHRINIPYTEYFLALGPMLPLGLMGLILVLVKRERKFYPFVSWILAIFLLFKIFENIPEQSASRFTEGAINIPLGITAAYLLNYLGKFSYLRKISKLAAAVLISVGFGVMVSLSLWLYDQAVWKKEATFPVAIGAQLAYPLKDFMNGIYFLRDHTDKNSVVLGYITSGNYIPAYAGNFVYIGHANTPDEDSKEKIAVKFFKADMNNAEANDFLLKNRINYIYFGPQEKELGNIADLTRVYSFISPVYINNRVVIYKYGGIKS